MVALAPWESQKLLSERTYLHLCRKYSFSNNGVFFVCFDIEFDYSRESARSKHNRGGKCLKKGSLFVP